MRTVFEIKDISGDVVALHVRVDLPGGKKNVFWQIPGGDPRDGLMGIGVADLPLYGTERLANLAPGATVLVTEGEKATEALWSLGIPAVGTVTGASSTPGEDVLSPLLPFDVVTWEDHDEPGEKHMARSIAGLRRLGGDGRRLLWGHEKGDDAADFLARGGTRLTAELLIRAAERWRLDADPLPVRAPRPSYDTAHGSWRVDRARGQLVDVVERHLGPPRKKDGRSLFWHCPFHNGDREASFKVDLREPFFRCFGCDARGDVFAFLKLTDGVSFRDVLRELAPEPLLGAAIPW